VDDAHWLDASSLRFLGYLAARVKGMPVLIVATVRSGEPEASGRILGELRLHPWTSRLEPAPLGEGAAGELVAATLGYHDDGLARSCHELTAGNPFYLRELLHDVARRPDTLEAPRPRTVAQMVEQRLARLPDGAVELTRGVSLLGPRASLRTTALLAELPLGEATRVSDALVAADVLRPELPLAFVHPLVRRVVYSGIPPIERNTLHARAAALLADAGAEPAETAVHLLATEPNGDPGAAATLASAARDAAARGAPEAAATYLRRALEEPPPADRLPELVRQLGRAEAALAGPGAVATLERALELAPNPDARAEIALELSLILRISSEFPRAIAILKPVLAELPPGSALSERVEGELINVALFAGESGTPTAFEHLARYFDPAERDRVRDAGLLASLATVMAGSNQPVDVAVGLAERALAAMPAEDADPSIALYVVYVLAYCDRFAAARAAAEALAAQGVSRGSVVTYCFALATLCQVGLREGALPDAEADARRCMDAYRDLPVDPLDPIAFLVDVLIERGELDEAAAIMEGAPLEGREERWDTLVLRGSRGRLRLARGDARGALDDLLQAGARLVQGGALNPAVMAWRSSAALAHLALGEREAARRLAEEELELARSFGAARALGIALRCSGLVEGHRAAAERLEESVEVLDGSGAQLEHAHSLCELGAALRRDGRSPAAQEPLRQALDLAAACGAAPLSARARDELRAAGARPRRDHVRGRDALTASELRVARLAAEGATNREIAQSLFVTLRTVETHLTHAYRKLDIGSRSEIAAALEDQGG
jgi:DNA-binding CsgD family transcriptional regulator